MCSRRVNVYRIGDAARRGQPGSTLQSANVPRYAGFEGHASGSTRLDLAIVCCIRPRTLPATRHADPSVPRDLAGQTDARDPVSISEGETSLSVAVLQVGM